MAKTKSKTKELPIVTASFSRVSTFFKCQVLGALRYQDKCKPKGTAPHLWVGTAVHEAIERYYKFEVDSPKEGAIAVLQERLAEAGIPEAFFASMKAADIEKEILEKFANGEITKPNGDRYSSPRMTKAYKELAESTGLDKIQRRLSSFQLGDVLLDEKGVAGVVSRVMFLAERYQNTLLYDRDLFSELYVEDTVNIDIPTEHALVRYVGYMDLLGKLKEPIDGKNWMLIDYKTGAAKSFEEHQASADSSLQLSLYDAELLKRGISNDDVKIALHFPDAGYEAATTRTEHDMDIWQGVSSEFARNYNSPGIPKRLFYDSMDCQGCDLRDACIAKYGWGTTVANTTRGQ